MTNYTATLPQNLLWDRGAIDALLGLGGITMTYDVDAPNRRSAVRMLGDEFDWRNLDHDWWDNHLSGKRGRR